DARFQMRCGPLVTVLMVFILLGNYSDAARRVKQRQRPSTGIAICKANPKANQMSSKAVSDAKAAKDAQSCAAEAAGKKVKNMMADKASQAAKAAEAALSGKKQLCEELTKNLGETKRVMQEVQRAITASSRGAKTAKRIRDSVRRNFNAMRCLYAQMIKNVESVRRVASNAQRELAEKRSLFKAAKRRVEELNTCLEHGYRDLERNRENAKKANCAAEEARQRIDVMRQLVFKIKNLKKKDLQSLKSLIRRRRRQLKTNIS
ncbi:hypothetical protein KR026_005177, partial [Drosophila bipectinata]